MTDPTRPGDVDPAPASADGAARVEDIVARILADVHDPSWSPAGEDLDDLVDRLESTWSAWRQALGRTGDPRTAA